MYAEESKNTCAIESTPASLLGIETQPLEMLTLDTYRHVNTLDVKMLRTNILGVGVNVINMNDAIEFSDALIQTGGKGYICVTDVHGIVEAQSDAAFRNILNHSFMTTPDGMPLVWVAKLQGHRRISRVYGPDYLIDMCRVSVQRGYRHFFYGGKPGVAELLVVKLKEKFSDLQVVGTYTPPFRPLNQAEEDELEAMVAEAKPDLFWVGLGSPKQEQFMTQYYKRLDARLMVGVGAAFDIHSGIVKEAPHWLKVSGFQWAHRLVLEPRRLWKRYLRCVPRFLWKIALQLSGISRFNLDE